MSTTAWTDDDQYEAERDRRSFAAEEAAWERDQERMALAEEYEEARNLAICGPDPEPSNQLTLDLA